MKLYRIANWEASFETYETKKLTHLKWVPVPNKHDGLGFRRVAAQKNRCELFAAWNLILQIASKGRKDVERGCLIRGGIALTPDDMAMMTGFPSSIFDSALEFFSSPTIGWLVVDNQDTGEPPVKTAASRTETAEPPAEWKEGIEGKGIEGKEQVGVPEVTELTFPQILRTDAFMKTWAEWIAYRKERAPCKKWLPMFQKQLEWLGEFPEPTARAMIDQSIRNNWQALVEVKNYGTSNNHSGTRNGGSAADRRNAVISGAEQIRADIKAMGDADDLPFSPG